MPQFPDWISRLFTPGNAKGLSGQDAENLDPTAAYYGPRLMKHAVVGDVIEDPTLLWSEGLRNHLRAHMQTGTADFTDVLVVVNSHDFTRTFNQIAEPWADAAVRSLSAHVEQFCASEGLELLFHSRGVRFRVIQDGGAEMGAQDYELQAGEFVTGLLPNLYTGSLPTSRPVVAVHLNLPDVWEGYREVGRLYSDQVAFTLGNHWLDNFSHFALNEPALYRLQQYLDGSFVHIIDPDLQGQYSVVNNQEAGANVLSLVDANGEAVAHLVLALMDSIVPDAGIDNDDLPRVGALPTPVVPEPSASTFGSLDGLGGKTIVPEGVQDRIFTLKERGALLQKVHFRKFMRGYDVYVSAQGNLTTRAPDRAATFQVRSDQVSLVVHKPTVRVDGRPAPLETPMPLSGSVELKVGTHTFTYNDLTTQSSNPGWPYLGEIIRPSSSNHMVFGGTYGVGRDRRNKVQLPDEPHNDNIVWLDNTNSGTIRARSGEIKKSQFYTDSIMVASRHAEVDLSGEPKLHGIAKHCFSYVRRGGHLISLYPTKRDGQREIDLLHGDEVLIGNCLFQVGFGPEGGQKPKMAPPPVPKLTAESLARAADDESSGVFGGIDSLSDPVNDPLEAPPRRPQRTDRPPASLIDEILGSRGAPSPPPRPTPQPGPDAMQATPSLDALLNERKTPEPDELPAAGGLGEAGAPPPLPELSSPGFDSLMGDSLSSEVDVVEVIDEVDEDWSEDPDDAPTGLDGDLFGLPGPTAPRQEFEMAPEQLPATRERMVEMEVEPQEQVESGDTWNAGLLETPTPTPDPPPQLAPTEPEPDPEPVDLPTPPPAPLQQPPPNAESLPAPSGIAVVDEDQVQVELGRPARLVTVGWALAGDATVGNHYGCSVVIPESRLEDDQEFLEHTYFVLKVRGHRGKATLRDPDEARMEQDGEPVDSAKGLDDVAFTVIRRDEDGDEDFVVDLALDPDFEVPDPRGRLLRVDLDDRIVAALFIRGLPLGTPRDVNLGSLSARATFDGSTVTLTDYLASYRGTDGRYAPFFHQQQGGPFRTVPEDGRAIELQPGDVLIAGTEVLRFELR